MPGSAEAPPVPQGAASRRRRPSSGRGVPRARSNRSVRGIHGAMVSPGPGPGGGAPSGPRDGGGGEGRRGALREPSPAESPGWARAGREATWAWGGG